MMPDLPQFQRAGVSLLCKALVLQRRAVDLDDALVLLEERLPLGTAAILDAFDVQTQGPSREGEPGV